MVAGLGVLALVIQTGSPTYVEAPGKPVPTVPSGERGDLASQVDRAIAQLTRGQVLLNAPEAFDLGDKVLVEARISRDLEQQLADGLKGSGVAVLELVDVSPYVSAELVGDDFVIEPPGPIDQVVGSEGFSQWSWLVSATSAGEHSLGLRVMVRFKLEGQAEERKQATFITRRVEVRPDLPGQVQKFVADNAEWLATSIAIPLLGLAWHAWRRGHSGSMRSPADGRPTHPGGGRRRAHSSRRQAVPRG
jgi:hypothetical protein